MRYIPNTPKVAQEMLQLIGVPSLEQLLASIPESVQLGRALKIPSGMPEADTLELFQAFASQNRGAQHLHFLGGGSYDHFIPLTIDSLISRAEFFTSYTPYQAEVSQGTLQTIFEFQSFICSLTGLEVANASVYDGAVALTEGVFMADRIQRKRQRVLVPESLHPNYLAVLKTHLHNLPLQLETVPVSHTGQMDLSILEDRLGSDVVCVVVQQPNFYGVIEDLKAIAQLAKKHGVLTVTSTTEALSLPLLESPGACGADIATGEAQSFGVPMSFGGPYVGFMATLDEHKRNIPGRIVGKTLDMEGRPGFTLTLSTREQHIRRERATSNICTNQNLIMVIATVYLTLMGRQGLQEVARQNLAKMNYFRQELSKLPQYGAPFSGAVFNEMVIQGPCPASEIIAAGLREGLIPGIDLGTYSPVLANRLLVCITENRKRPEIDRLLAFLAQIS